VPFQWRDNQVLGLRLALGMYGMSDYLPVNAILSTQGAVTTLASGGRYIANDLDEARHRGWTGIYRSTVHPGALVGVFPGQWNALYPTGVFMLPPSQYANWSNPPNTWHTDWATRSQFLYFNNTQSQVYDPNVSGLIGSSWTDLEAAAILRPLMFRQPENWPTAFVGSFRARIRTGFINLARVRLTDPASGAVREFSFNIFGTTLRGARQQRRHPDIGGGWARWHGTGAAGNDRTIDE
jgi:hypothetical protein